MIALDQFVATHKATCNGSCPCCTLIAEIERLRAENERLDKMRQRAAVVLAHVPVGVRYSCGIP